MSEGELASLFRDDAKARERIAERRGEAEPNWAALIG